MKMQKIIGVVCLCGFMVSCAVKAPIPKSGLFSVVNEFKQFEDSHLFYYINDDNLENLTTVKVIQINNVTVSFKEVQEPRHSILRQNIQLFEERLYYNAVRELSPPLIICRPHDSIRHYEELAYVIADLQIDIVEVKYGSGLLRYLIGFGAGGVLIHVEGILKDSESNRKYAEFIFRERCTGEPMMGLNFRVMSKKYCLRGGLDKAAEAIAAFCQTLLIPEQVLEK